MNSEFPLSLPGSPLPSLGEGRGWARGRGVGRNLTLYADRQAIAPLLRDHSPEDALAAYYALHHSEIRTKLTVHRDERGQALGFMAVCQTGFDLFQPLAVLRAPTANGADVAAWLLRNGLAPARSYHILVPPALAPAVEVEMNCHVVCDPLGVRGPPRQFQTDHQRARHLITRPGWRNTFCHSRRRWQRGGRIRHELAHGRVRRGIRPCRVRGAGQRAGQVGRLGLHRAPARIQLCARSTLWIKIMPSRLLLPRHWAILTLACVNEPTSVHSNAGCKIA